jgi:flagellar biosynthesis/type III secretory pathway protein FliH
LREVLLYIKYSREKEKLLELLKNDTGFRNLKTETAIMLNILTNSELKFNEEKEETSMCLAIDELREEAKQEGIEFGRREGSENSRRELIRKMLMNHETMDKIKEYTGYTQKKIDEIAKELSAR